MRLIKLGFLLLGCVLLIDGCTSYKNIAYFGDLSDSARLNVIKPKYHDLLIAPDDILSINIQTMDPSSGAIFNQSPISPLSSSINAQAQASLSSSLSSQQSSTNPNGYLVNKNGDIDIPILGKFHLAGHSTLEAEDSILTSALFYYKNPTVYVRFANFKVNVLGEVARPGTYIIPNERATIFDALGLAGDLTIFGKRENVLLIRDSANQSELIRLNLTSKQIVNSEYFYLRKNDVIYVEPSKSKLANLDASQNKYYAIAAGIVSVIIIAATRIP